MKAFPSVAIALACATAGCHSNSSDSTAAGITGVDLEDAEMNAAIAKAQATLNEFTAALGSPKPNQEYFLVKGKFTSGDAVEHIWVADLDYDGERFRGVLANDPESIPGLKFKQKVEVALADVSDWMIVQDGKLVGGYTSKVLRKRMTLEERKEQDAQVPYKYE